MKLLLLQNIDITSARGANKANRVMLEQLQARGHQCRVISPFMDRRASNGAVIADAKNALASDGLVVTSTEGGIEVDRVHERTAGAAFRLVDTKRHILGTLRTYSPDVVMVAGEDPGQVLLTFAVESFDHVGYIARSTSTTGVGPMAFFPNQRARAALQRVKFVLANSEYSRRYLQTWAQCDADVFDINTYTLPADDRITRNSFDDDEKFVTMINPCGIKGIDIFIELAERLPNVRFAAVPLWGTTRTDLARLSSICNVTILEPVSNIDSILEKTRILLFPSLWDEAFGRTIIEAMAFGIPVVASNVGGVPEAKLGVDYVLPVEQIKCYRRTLDDKGIPTFHRTTHDLGPWWQALLRLLRDREAYEAVSAQSRRAASHYIRSLDIAKLEAAIRRITQAG